MRTEIREKSKVDGNARILRSLQSCLSVKENFAVLQSVSWSLAEFRHNKIVQLPRENCLNVCRQLQRKVRSHKHDV